MNSGINSIDVIVDKEWLYEVFELLNSEAIFDTINNENLLKWLIDGKKKF